MSKKLIAAGLAAMLAAACTTNPYTGERRASRTATSGAGGAAAGAAAGAVLGEIIGDRAGKGAMWGAIAGAGIGTGIGVYQDRQQAKLRQQLQGTGVSVTRDGDNIILNMPGNVTFDSGSANIQPSFYDVLNSVAVVLEEFDKTVIGVYGHTDSDGSDDYNQQLSERRASAVASYLISQGVYAQRFRTIGYGEQYPVAPNTTPAGKAQNRRVEIELVPVS